MSINPRGYETIANRSAPITRTISYAWSDEQYQTIKFLGEKENRKMRNMLFHIVELYVKNLPDETKSELNSFLTK